MRAIAFVALLAVIGCASSPDQVAARRGCTNYGTAVDPQVRHLAHEITRIASRYRSAGPGAEAGSQQGLALIEEIRKRKGSCLLPGYAVTEFVEEHERQLRTIHSKAVANREANAVVERAIHARRRQVQTAQVATATPALKVELVDFSSSRDKTTAQIQFTNLTQGSVLDTRFYRCEREPRKSIYGTQVEVCRHYGINLRDELGNVLRPNLVLGPRALAPGESRLITVEYRGSVSDTCERATIDIWGVEPKRDEFKARLTFPPTLGKPRGEEG